MAEMLLMRTAGGTLAPQCDEDAERIRRYKVGATIRCVTSEIRNSAFHKKWWALAKLAFDLWSETMPDQEYRGQEVQRSFQRFRRDLIILAGHFQPVWAVNGEMRVEAKSISFARMDSETFEALYSATINAVLAKILTHTKLTEADLRAQVDRVLEFDR